MEQFFLILPFLLLGMAGFASWQRKILFRNANATCQMCGRKWSDGYMLEAHHILALSDGGKSVLPNGTMVCVSCHADAHEEVARDFLKSGERKKANHHFAMARKIRSRSIWRKNFKR
jgi:hypothetical protein